jgi:hypothetical protein
MMGVQEPQGRIRCSRDDDPRPGLRGSRSYATAAPLFLTGRAQCVHRSCPEPRS